MKDRELCMSRMYKLPLTPEQSMLGMVKLYSTNFHVIKCLFLVIYNNFGQTPRLFQRKYRCMYAYCSSVRVSHQKSFLKSKSSKKCLYSSVRISNIRDTDGLLVFSLDKA